MIRLPPRPETKPERMRGRTVAQKKAALTRKFRRGIAITHSDFDRNYYSHLDIRRPLWLWQAKKCCYCERRRDLRREPDVEHFRPKTKIDREPGLGYWWLAYEWSNLFFACKACNQEYKRTQFPLEEDGVRAEPGQPDLSSERPTLANPAEEDPELLIGYFWISVPEPLAKPVGLDPAGRGDRLIRILGLDRDDLNQERGALIDTLMAYVETFNLALHLDNQAVLDRAVTRVRRMTSRDHMFLGFRRFFFRQHGLGEYLSDD